RLRPLAAWLGGIAFAGSGFIGGHVGQINQLNAYAWFPALLWVASALPGLKPSPGQKGISAAVLIGAIFAVQLLAGHTQAWYISAIGVGLYLLAHLLGAVPAPAAPSNGRVMAWSRLPGGLRLILSRAGAWPLLILALGLVIGLGLAAIQLVPTLELSALSPRANGMTYREVVSFSLKPQWLPWALLPAYGQNLAARFGTVAYAEYVAYLGVSGLLLAMWGARVGKRWRWPLLALALGGLALAVGAYNPLYYLAYRVIPGWALFRAPARWLLLYTAGMAGLIAVGVDALQARAGQRPRLRWLIWAGGALLVVELLVASNLLPHTHPTAPAAVTSLRNAPAYLLSEPGLWRFLSMSGITYDPGDQADLAHLFAGQLDPAALYDLIVASKQKEIVAPNLPLLWRLSSVDGYDGGVLPLTRYVDLQRLFVPDDQLAPDGRLREQLRRVPPAPLLDLLNTRFIITDKVFDVWVDNVYYDLQFSAPLAAGETWRQTLPADQPFEATALGVMSHLAGAASLADGTPVAAVRVQAADGRWTAFALRAGQDTAEGSWRAGAVAHQPARSAHPWRDHADGQDYLTVLTLTAPSQIVTVEVTGTAPGSDFVLQGVSLIDVRTGSSQALITPAQGDWRRVHSGDVKIYEKRDVLPRAYVAPATGVIEVADAAAALEALRRPDFAPGQQVVLEADRSLPAPVAINRDASSGQATAAAAGRAVIERYAPEQVVISATLTAPGILVLSDTHYPGWRATVDGAPVRIEQANLLFRGLRLAPGVHRVVFDFAPASLMQGQRITFITFITLLGLGVWFLLRSRISNLPS
ncbi:MAG: YfhO family protein, partial [Anaerolineae bacterium]